MNVEEWIIWQTRLRRKCHSHRQDENPKGNLNFSAIPNKMKSQARRSSYFLAATTLEEAHDAACRIAKGATRSLWVQDKAYEFPPHHHCWILCRSRNCPRCWHECTHTQPNPWNYSRTILGLRLYLLMVLMMMTLRWTKLAFQGLEPQFQNFLLQQGNSTVKTMLNKLIINVILVSVCVYKDILQGVT